MIHYLFDTIHREFVLNSHHVDFMLNHYLGNAETVNVETGSLLRRGTCCLFRFRFRFRCRLQQKRLFLTVCDCCLVAAETQ